MISPAECGRYGCGETVVYHACPVHGTGCACQYGPATPKWYGSVATCPIHRDEYDRSLAPAWALAKQQQETWRVVA